MSLAVSSHTASSRAPVHFHDEPYACVVVEGLFTEASDGAQQLFEPGAAIYHPNLHRHSDSFHAPTRCLNLTCLGEGLSLLPKRKKTKRTLSWARSIVRELLLPEADRLGLEAKALALLNDLTTPAMPGWLAAARQLTDERFSRDLSIGWLSEILDVHPVHFARSFRSEFGIGYEGYLNSVRLRQAERLLLSTSDSIAEISYRCGFTEPSALSRSFKQLHGITPRACRYAN